MERLNHRTMNRSFPMRVILLILAVITILFAYASVLSREPQVYIAHPQQVYSDCGTSYSEVMPC